MSKYARMEPRDREWIRPGLQAEVLSIAILDGRFARTPFLDAHEASRARKALEEDRRWLRAQASAEAVRRDAGSCRRRPAPEAQNSPPPNE